MVAVPILLLYSLVPISLNTNGWYQFNEVIEYDKWNNKQN